MLSWRCKTIKKVYKGSELIKWIKTSGLVKKISISRSGMFSTARISEIKKDYFYLVKYNSSTDILLEKIDVVQ